MKVTASRTEDGRACDLFYYLRLWFPGLVPYIQGKPSSAGSTQGQFFDQAVTNKKRN